VCHYRGPWLNPRWLKHCRARALGEEIDELSAHSMRDRRILELIRECDARADGKPASLVRRVAVVAGSGIDRGGNERVRVARGPRHAPRLPRPGPRRAVLREGSGADPRRDSETEERAR